LSDLGAEVILELSLKVELNQRREKEDLFGSAWCSRSRRAKPDHHALLLDLLLTIAIRIKRQQLIRFLFDSIHQ